jgi:hypothetical protein
MGKDFCSLGKWRKDGEYDYCEYCRFPYETDAQIVKRKFQELLNLVGKRLPAGRR